MKTTALTPVLFVFCRYELDTEKVRASLLGVQSQMKGGKRLRVIYDCVYEHTLSGLEVENIRFQ